MVSVIIPTYNRSDYLKKCLKSIISQTYSDIEIIVIDDGSGDDTKDVIQAISDNRIKYLNYGKIGDIAKLRNIAISNSQGEYIAFCDDDDLWEFNKIELQLPYLKNYDFVCSNAKIIDKFGNVTDNKLHKSIYHDKQLTISELLLNNTIITSSVIINKEVASIGFVESGSIASAEDYEMWLNISTKYKLFCLSKELVYFRIHNNTTSAQSSLKRVELILNVIQVLSRFVSNSDRSIRLIAKKGVLLKKFELRRIYIDRNEYIDAIKITLSILYNLFNCKLLNYYLRKYRKN